MFRRVDLSILSDGTDSVPKSPKWIYPLWTFYYVVKVCENILDKWIKFIYNKFR